VFDCGELFGGNFDFRVRFCEENIERRVRKYLRKVQRACGGRTEKKETAKKKNNGVNRLLFGFEETIG
jgi:hypothetical protein